MEKALFQTDKEALNVMKWVGFFAKNAGKKCTTAAI